MTHKLTSSEFKKLSTRKKIYVRSGEARFLTTRASVIKTIKSIKAKTLIFVVEFDEQKIFIETVEQTNKLFPLKK